MSTIVTNAKVNSTVEVCNCSSYCIFTFFSYRFLDQSLQSWDAIWFLEMNLPLHCTPEPVVEWAEVRVWAVPTQRKQHEHYYSLHGGHRRFIFGVFHG